MTPNEITTLVASKYDKAFDYPFKLMIMEHVKALRTRFMRQTLEKSPKDRKFFTQTVYLKLTNEKEVNCELPVTLCNVSITKNVPKPLRVNKVLFDYVGTINGTKAFQEVAPGMISYMNSGKYSKNNIYYSWVNQDIAVHKEGLPMIRVDYIPEDPLELEGYMCSSSGELCDAWNTEYPVSGEILQRILQYIHESLKPALPEEVSLPLDDKSDVEK